MLARRSLGGLVQERERRDGPGRVVRVVQPQDRGRSHVAASTASRSGRNPRSLAQRQPQHVRRRRTARRARGSCTRARSRAPGPCRPAGSRTACARENTISFDPSIGSTWVSGSTVDAEPAARPSRRSPRGARADPPRVGTTRSARPPPRSASRMNGGGHLARIADAEVDQRRGPSASAAAFAPIELLERVRLHVPDARRQVRHVASSRRVRSPGGRPEPRNAAQDLVGSARAPPPRRVRRRDERTAGRPDRSSRRRRPTVANSATGVHACLGPSRDRRPRRRRRTSGLVTLDRSGRGVADRSRPRVDGPSSSRSRASASAGACVGA